MKWGKSLLGKLKTRLTSTHKTIVEKAESIFRRFGKLDEEALEELEDRTFRISVDAFSFAPEEAAGYGLECEAQDPEEGIWVVIREGQVQIENP